MIEEKKQELLKKTDLEASTIILTYSTEDIYIKQIDDSICIYINKDLYEQHKEEIDEMLIEYIRKYKNNSITITSGQLITDKIVNALCENDNIKIISLAKYSFVSKYSLSKKHFELFKKANKEKIKTTYLDDELKDVYDPIIEQNYDKILFGYYKYSDLKADKITFFSSIAEKDLHLLQLLGDNTEVKLTTNCNIKDIIETLKKYNKKNKITIEVYNNDLLLKEVSKLGCFDSNYKLEENNIYVKPISISRETISLNDYISYEKLLYSIIEPAMNMSPYEKYIYAYDITKKFKKYSLPKKDNKNTSNLPYDEKAKIRGMSRDLFSILDNNYIVCVGFANLLSDLLTKLGIENIGQSVEIDVARHKAIKQLISKTPNWKKLTPQEKKSLISKQLLYIPKTSYEGHRRIIARIKDDKYGIDGIYFSDPTWDNDLEKNSYAHMTMTEDEVSSSMSTVKIDSSFLLFSATSVDELYQMINIILDKRKKEREEEYKEEGEEINIERINEDDASDLQGILLNFFKKIKSLFPDEYAEINNRYPRLGDYSLDIDSVYSLPDDLTDALYEIANLIISKNNNKISDETLSKAVKEVYKDVYEGGLNQEELDKMMEDTNMFRTVEFSSRK